MGLIYKASYVLYNGQNFRPAPVAVKTVVLSTNPGFANADQLYEVRIPKHIRPPK